MTIKAWRRACRPSCQAGKPGETEWRWCLGGRIAREVGQHGANGGCEFRAMTRAGRGDDDAPVMRQPIDDELATAIDNDVGLRRVGIEADVAFGEWTGGAGNKFAK